MFLGEKIHEKGFGDSKRCSRGMFVRRGRGWEEKRSRRWGKSSYQSIFFSTLAYRSAALGLCAPSLRSLSHSTSEKRDSGWRASPHSCRQLNSSLPLRHALNRSPQSSRVQRARPSPTMPTPESEAFLAKKPKVPPTFDGVDYDDTPRLKQAQDAIIREQWVKSMMARLVREELGKCYYREGVNHLEKCGALRGKLEYSWAFAGCPGAL